jgi:hypothetical protein
MESVADIVSGICRICVPRDINQTSRQQDRLRLADCTHPGRTCGHGCSL